MQHVAPADRVPGHHRDHWLGQGADLLLQIEHVQARHAVGPDVALRAADTLVAAGAERLGARSGEDGDAGLGILADVLEALLQLEESLRAEGVADLGAVDGDLRDPVARFLVDDVLVLLHQVPLHRSASTKAWGRSRWGAWPQSGMEISWARGSNSSIRAASAENFSSRVPAIRRTGTRRPRSSLQ